MDAAEVEGHDRVGLRESLDRSRDGAAAPQFGRDLLECCRQRGGEAPLAARAGQPQPGRAGDHRCERGERGDARCDRQADHHDPEHADQPELDCFLRLAVDVGIHEGACESWAYATGQAPPPTAARRAETVGRGRAPPGRDEGHAHEWARDGDDERQHVNHPRSIGGTPGLRAERSGPSTGRSPDEPSANNGRTRAR